MGAEDLGLSSPPCLDRRKGLVMEVDVPSERPEPTGFMAFVRRIGGHGGEGGGPPLKSSTPI